MMRSKGGGGMSRVVPARFFSRDQRLPTCSRLSFVSGEVVGPDSATRM